MPRPVGPLAALDAARGHLFCWLPVAQAMGIGLYFMRGSEPGAGAYLLAALLGLGAGALAAPGWRIRPVMLALMMAALGFLSAGGRAHWLAAPVLAAPYHGPVTGRIVAIDRAASDALRLTLDQVHLSRRGPAETPAHVRISLYAPPGFQPEPGMTVVIRADLSAPPGPAEPGGFDFRRMAWFDRLGAVGYSRAPLRLWYPGPGEAPLARLRLRLAEAIRAAVPGAPGAFAAAVATGDRMGIGQGVIGDLRAANTAHLLAISGLHMGLLAGFVFTALRLVMAAVPWIALRWPTKKIAALAALAAAAFYLALSGGNVATERAFLMVAVMFGAVLCERRALSLRSVALAAMLILLHRPESLTEPGFQMSFAATTALIASYGPVAGRGMRALPRWLRPLGALIAASVIAGGATAPFGAASFHRISAYGLAANLLSVPVMGAVVMPMTVLAGLLAPLGLAAAPLWLMGQAAAWILWVAHQVAGWPGAVRGVVDPGPWALPLLSLGALWLLLWPGRARWGGGLAVLLALGLWSGATRPALLISDSGRLVGLWTPQGRMLSRPASARGFVGESWLERDGQAGAIPAPARGFGRFEIAGRRGLLLSGRPSKGALARACAEADLVITSAPADAAGGCLMIDAGLLAVTGALALNLPNAAPPTLPLAFETAAQKAGRRLWTGDRPITPPPVLPPSKKRAVTSHDAPLTLPAAARDQ